MYHIYRGCQECLLGRGDLSRARPTSVILRASPQWAASMASSANAPVPRISTSCKSAYAYHLIQAWGRRQCDKTGGWQAYRLIPPSSFKDQENVIRWVDGFFTTWNKRCGLVQKGRATRVTLYFKHVASPRMHSTPAHLAAYTISPV